ncbi:MAG: autotransporter family protein [Pirellulales bacterium]
MSNARVLSYSLLVVAVSCASALAWDPWKLDPAYLAGVQNSQIIDPNKGVHNLTTITDPPGDWVEMTTFTDWKYQKRLYDVGEYRPDLWAAVAGQMHAVLADPNLPASQTVLRAKQLLGLPASHPGILVIEYKVHAGSLFRPCKAPDITNPNSSFEFPPGPGGYPRQWFDGNLTTYDPVGTSDPYPWTQMGYTYDWGNPNTIVGLTEFIATKNDPGTPGFENPMDVQAVVSILSYKYYDRNGNFNVTDNCDTIWAGSVYTPVLPGGNWITIAPTATISGGEGITVSSAGFLVTNQGVIQGPGRNSDGSLRASSLLFQAGGQLINSGVIAGDTVGVLAAEGVTGDLIVENSGVIQGLDYAIRTRGGNDVIINRGLVDGRIFTDTGDDTVNILGGVVTGSIDGGTGTNTLDFDLAAGATFASDARIANFTSINVNSGTVRLNGDTTGNVAIAHGATFGGNAYLHGSLTNDGVVSPGNSIGTIRVGGNYTQSAQGKLIVEVAEPWPGTHNTSDQLYLNSNYNATLAQNSTVDVQFSPGGGGLITTGDTFNIITTRGTGVITDQGAVFTSNSAFLDFSGAVQGQTYVMSVDRTATFASVASGRNYAAMAAALDADVASGAAAASAITPPQSLDPPAAGPFPGNYAGLVNELSFMNQSEFNEALSGLSGSPYHAVDAASIRTAQYLAQGMSQYLRTRRAGLTGSCAVCPSGSAGVVANGEGEPCGEAGCDQDACQELKADCPCQTAPYNRRAAFADPFGVFFGEKSTADRVGFQANSAGLQIGIDNEVDPGCIAGLATAYSNTHVSFDDWYGAADTDTVRVGPYLSWFNNEAYLDFYGSCGFHDNDVSRNYAAGTLVGTAQSEYHGHDVSLYLGGGYDYCLGETILTPTASAQYVFYHQSDFTEWGGNGADLAVSGNNSNSLRSEVGARLTRTLCWRSTRILPEVFGGWAHEYLANDRLYARFAGGDAVFAVSRGGVFRDGGYFGAGVTMLPCAGVSLFARYNGEVSGGGDFNACDAGLVLLF